MTETATTSTFTDFGVDDRICAALERHGIRHPFPIQEQTLPMALSGADVIGQARTGTGKTLAFGIPLLQRLDTERGTVQALVVVPTRELCLQVHDDLATAGADMGVATAAIYGGRDIDEQSARIAAGAQVVVGTPGRLLDLMRRGTLSLSEVTGLVLDEADEMLDMGFLPDVEQIIQACARERQTMLFSATMPSEVVGLARRYMDKPTFMRADVEEPRIAPETQQFFLSCHRMDKPAVLARILRAPDRGLCVVFTRTKRMADVLVDELAEHGVTASAIHSNLRQDARERTLKRFREGKVDVLCATEVAARGLDISDVTHVINYDCPDDEKMYLHRIGRTGRAGAAGIAVTLAVWNELARLEMIKRALEIDAPTHEVFSTSPLLDELFGLPPSEPRGGGDRGGRSSQRTGERARTEPTRRGRETQRSDQPVPGTERPAQQQATPDDDAAAPPARDGDVGDQGPRSSQGGSRRRRGRRGGRGRGGSGDRGQQAARQQQDQGTTSAPQGQQTAGPRRDASDDDAATTATDAPAAKARSGERRRVRRRAGQGPEGDERDEARGETTSAAPAPTSERPAATQPSGERARPESGKRQEPPSSEREEAPATDEGERRRVRRREGGRSAARQGEDAPRERQGATKRTGTGGGAATTRDDGDGGTRRRRGARGGQERDAGAAPTPAPTQAAGKAARGEGKPALQRPMTITHLP